MDSTAYTLRDWLAEHPPDDSAFAQTVAGVARRVLAGEEFQPAVREFPPPAESPPDFERLVAIGVRYGMQIEPPPEA